MKATLNQIRVSPKKAELIADLIRNKPVREAQTILKFTPKNAARVLLKVVNSAAHNAENNFNQKIDDLHVIKVHVGKGTTYKRFQPVSRGRAHPILKRTSNITIEVGIPVEEGGKKKAEKKIEAETQAPKVTEKKSKTPEEPKKTKKVSKSSVVVKEKKKK